MITFKCNEKLDIDENNLKEQIAAYLEYHEIDTDNKEIVVSLSLDPLSVYFNAIAEFETGETRRFKGLLDGSKIEDMD